MIFGQGDFHGRVEEVFKAAKRSAPSVIFIDETEVILEDNGNRGFYRYLLTMLDGMESASAGSCFMPTMWRRRRRRAEWRSTFRSRSPRCDPTRLARPGGKL